MRFAWTVVICLVTAIVSVAQTRTEASQPQVPRLIRFNGSIAADSSTSDVAGVTFALYQDQEGGSPLWIETQNVRIDQQGHYSVLLGSEHKDGIPADLFYSNAARWLGVKVAGQEEQPRVLLVSVPYALKAGDAETLGGRPASSFALANPQIEIATSPFVAPSLQTGIVPSANSGTTDFIGKFINATDLGDSVIYENPTTHFIGIGTTSPQTHLQLNGNLILQGKTTHSIRLAGAVSTGRLGQDANGFFFSVDTPGKTMRVLTTPVGGSLTDRFVVTSTGNVGIGTSVPNNKLSVVGTIESTSGGFKFPDGSTLSSALNQGASTFTGNTISQILAVTQQGTGSAATFAAQGTGTAANFTASNTTQTISVTQNGAGVSQFNPSGVPAGVRGDSTTNTGNAAGVFGTSSSYLGYGVTGVNLSTCDPNDLAHCNAMGVFGMSAAATRGTGVWGEAETTTGDNVGVFGKSVSDSGTGVYGYANSTSGDATGVFGYSTAPTGSGIFGEVDSATGTPAAVYGLVPAGAGVGGQFDVQTGGNILLGRSGTGTSFTNKFRVAADGSVFGKVFNTSGADFAESVGVNGGTSLYHPGDVLIVDETGVRRFTLSNEQYSTKVAGIYATQPGVLATTHHDGDPQLAEEVPLAIVGIVPCKVTAENGAIKAGDLLVSSSRPGYAMKGTDRGKMLGAVVGKALGSLDKDTGVIEILVSLH